LAADSSTLKPRRRRWRVDGGEVRDLAMLSALVVLSLAPLAPVFGWSGWWRPVLGGWLAALAVALAAAAFKLRGPTWAGLAALAYLAVGAAAAAPSQALFGFLVTLETVRSLVFGLVTTWKEVLTVPTPIGLGASFGVAPFALAFFGVLAAWRLRRWRRFGALAGLIPVAILGVALVLGEASSFAPLGVGLGSAGLGLVWAAARRGTFTPRRLTACAAMVAVMVAAGVGVDRWQASSGPGRLVLREFVATPFDPSKLPSPLAAHRHYVRDLAEEPIVTVTGLPTGVDMRVATMDAFDGIVWGMSGPDQSGSGAFVRPSAPAATAAQGRVIEIKVEVSQLEGVWLVTAGWPQEIVFAPEDGLLADALRVNQDSASALLVNELPSELAYTEKGLLGPSWTQDQIMAAGAAVRPVPEAAHVPDAVAMTAVDLAGDAQTAGALASSLADGLRERGFFSDGVSLTGPDASLAGHGADRIEAFLEAPTLIGNSEQYASAMALMARSLGLSSRVVLGFRGPEDVASGPLQFTGADLEAWVEVALDGLGWVAFYPTPPRDKTVSEADVTQEQEPEPNQLQPLPPNAAQPVPPDLEVGDVSVGESEDSEPAPEQAWLGTAVLVTAGSVIAALVAASPLGLIWLLKRRRRHRRRSAKNPVLRMREGWNEVLDVMADFKVTPPPGTTRLEQASALGARLGPARRSSLTALARASDEAHFAPFAPTDAAAQAYWESWTRLERSIRADAGRRSRWRAAVSTRSLRRRRRQRLGTRETREARETRETRRTRRAREGRQRGRGAPAGGR
jgi:hypothetical protein